MINVRHDFPILQQTFYGKPLAYLDNGATTQKPQVVIDAEKNFYEISNANVHRGVYVLSEQATAAYEGARKTVQQFINAHSEKEIIFTRGTTESINLVAQSFGRTFLKAGDEVIISAMEHHSNIVPWQMLREQIGIVLKVIPMNLSGELLLDEYEKLLSPKTKVVSIVHVSNALGTVNPIKKIIDRAHQQGAVVLIDAAQSIAHMPIDVQALGCDFLAFSSHKLYGPTGVGVLYGKQALLEKMPPCQGGGDMIKTVSFEKTTYADLPMKFEAGTPNIAGVIGLGAAIKYLEQIGLAKIAEYEHQLLQYATQSLQTVSGIRLIGTAVDKVGVISFMLEGVHPHDIASILDQQGVAVRAGHHCAMPVMTFFKVPATVRASLAVYNNREDIQQLVKGLIVVQELFK